MPCWMVDVRVQMARRHACRRMSVCRKYGGIGSSDDGSGENGSDNDGSGDDGSGDVANESMCGVGGGRRHTTIHRKRTYVEGHTTISRWRTEMYVVNEEVAEAEAENATESCYCRLRTCGVAAHGRIPGQRTFFLQR